MLRLLASELTFTGKMSPSLLRNNITKQKYNWPSEARSTFRSSVQHFVYLYERPQMWRWSVCMNDHICARWSVYMNDHRWCARWYVCMNDHRWSARWYVCMNDHKWCARWSVCMNDHRCARWFVCPPFRPTAFTDCHGFLHECSLIFRPSDVYNMYGCFYFSFLTPYKLKWRLRCIFY